MLIIIFLGMIALSVLGVWLKRRHRRKRDSNNASTFGPRDNFYPSNPHPGMQNVQGRGGVRPEMASANNIPPFAPAAAGVYNDAAAGGKGKAKATVSAAAVEGGSSGGGGLAQNVKRKLSKRTG